MQGRQYKRKRKKNNLGFVAVCSVLVLAVAAICASLARCERVEVPAATTTDSTVDTSFTTVQTTEEALVTTTPLITEVIATAETTTAVETTESAPRTFTYVEEKDGVKRIENFMFYEAGSPEYKLAYALYMEVPSVVKTAEVTETVAPETTYDPDITTSPTVETTAVTTIAIPDGTAETAEETVETYTYEVEGYAALYYEDLTDGTVMVFSPDKTIFGASMIKAVYVYSLLQLAERGDIDLAEEFIYKEDMFVEGSGDFKKVKDGTTFTAKELIDRTVRRSDNTAFSMLQKRYGTAFFAGIMQEKGLSPTRFGSWWRTNVMNYGRFFKVLSEYLLGENEYGGWLSEIMCESTQSVMLKNALRPDKVAHKYGWDEDSYCDGAVVLAEHPYVLVFMSNLDEGHTKSANTRFIYKVGGLVKQLHDEKYAALATAETTVAAETTEVSE